MRALVVATALVWTTSAWAQEDGASGLQERIAELERQSEEMAREIQELERKVKALERKVAERGGVRPAFAVHEPDASHLEGIELPEAATKEQVREYVRNVLEAAQGKNTFSTRDPEIEYLKRVGPENVDVLIEPLASNRLLMGDIYVIEALKSLVGERHKELILEALPSAKDLVKIVLARRWTEDAAPTLLSELATRPPYLPTEWIEAVARLERRESYPDLEAYLVRGSNPRHTWEAIRDLPDFDVAAAVEKAWKRPRREGWERGQMAVVAAHYGHVDALGIVADGVGGEDIWQAGDIFRDLTPFRGADDEANAWFEKSRARLVFDAKEGKYRLEPDKAPADPER